MGILRLFLALAVIESHTRQLFFPSVMIPGGYAVELFFMISGFYIALILNEKYSKKKNPYSLFISNRVLRLYPLYFIILLISLGIYFIFDTPNTFLASYLNVEWLPLLFILFANLFILGLDAPYFMTDIYFPQTILPQAWSLSLEFMFYFMAPSLVRLKTGQLIMIIFASIGLRVCLINNGLFDDPWSFRFFPTEIALFLLGILSYRIYNKLKNYRIPKIILLMSLLATIVFLTYWYPGFKFLEEFIPAVAQPITYPSYLIISYLAIWLALPFIFLLTKDLPFDRWIGEFSYPMYLTHIIVIHLVNGLKLTSPQNPLYGWIVAILCALLSAVLLYLVIYPIERLREHRIGSHKI